MSRQVLTKAQGGTGVANISEAAASLHLATNALIGQANGLIPLDSNGKIPLSKFANNTKVNLAGSLVAYVGVNNWYNITDFDSNRNYNISVTAGSVSRNGAFITFVPPATSQTVTLAVNGKGYSVVIQPAAPQTPVLVTPIDNASVLTTSYTFTTNAFVPLGDSSTHAMSDWQIATDVGFTNVTFQSLNDAVNKTAWTPTGLVDGTSYFARVRFKGSNGNWSNYSITKLFSIAVPTPVTPSIVYPAANAIDILMAFSVTTSSFTALADGSSHASTDWQMATDSGFTNIVKTSLIDTVNKVSWSVTGLTNNTNYYVRARHRSSSGKASVYSAVQHFTTVNRIATALTISASTYNYILNTGKVPGYIAGISDVTLTINSGVVVGAATTGSYALNVDTSWAAGDTVKIVNSGGYIVGAGGTGATGPNAANGFSGGPALIAQRSVSITNNGVIGGGGGGGGSGSICGAGSYNINGGSGGGGAGAVPGPGGLYTDAYGSNIEGSKDAGIDGTAGGTGTLTTGGARGIRADGVVDGGLGTPGGAGGSLGVAGDGGVWGYVPSGGDWHPGTGGAPGAAVVGNGNITWIASGDIRGPIQ